ncbi:DUF1993 domain-containing protein [Rhizobacter sp. Root1221]|uniref:DUF1993 family protein n=1 Tax=Rhizobacter sp. Root1221 TaxID=1736433 RepID=UPI0007008E2A|nr:DUF1993 domain-containing protein [Rhizobacter sp. Root1221]KQW02294.1 hypothetical protein ASC87_13810 [Rhizobacter sp. Root1221]
MRDAPHRHTASVPVFDRYLGQLGGLLDIAEAAGDPAVLDARLVAGMLPFGVQVEIACNFALRACFPLAGEPVPPYGDFPGTFAGLHDRMARVRTMIGLLPPAAFTRDTPIADQAGCALVTLPPDTFLFQYALPNFFFHVGAAYHILRQRGLAVGKADFDGFHKY